MAKESTMQPFEKGDIFLGCTQLNDPEDDHAGRGLNAQPDLLAANLKNRYADVVSDEEAFAGFSG